MAWGLALAHCAAHASTALVQKKEDRITMQTSSGNLNTGQPPTVVSGIPPPETAIEASLQIRMMGVPPPGLTPGSRTRASAHALTANPDTSYRGNARDGTRTLSRSLHRPAVGGCEYNPNSTRPMFPSPLASMHTSPASDCAPHQNLSDSADSPKPVIQQSSSLMIGGSCCGSTVRSMGNFNPSLVKYDGDESPQQALQAPAATAETPQASCIPPGTAIVNVCDGAARVLPLPIPFSDDAAAVGEQAPPHATSRSDQNPTSSLKMPYECETGPAAVSLTDPMQRPSDPIPPASKAPKDEHRVHSEPLIHMHVVDEATASLQSPHGGVASNPLLAECAMPAQSSSKILLPSRVAFAWDTAVARPPPPAASQGHTPEHDSSESGSLVQRGVKLFQRLASPHHPQHGAPAHHHVSPDACTRAESIGRPATPP